MSTRPTDPEREARQTQSGAEVEPKAGNDLAERMAALELRMARIERAFPWIAEQSGRDSSASTTPAGAEVSEKRVGQVGRTLLILGGAYLLRGITATEVVPTAAGLLLGTFYGLVWWISADRHQRRGRPVSATLFALASCMIVFPILWEATTRFQLLSPTAAALGLAVAGSSFLSFAWVHSVAPIAWLVTGSALGTAVGLAVSSGSAVSPLIAAAVVGCVAWWTARARSWPALAELSALVVDLGAIFFAVHYFLARPPISSFEIALTEVGLVGLYGLTFLLRRISGGENGFFEGVQLGSIATIGFVAALLAARSTPSVLQAIGVVALVYALGTTPGLVRLGASTRFYSALLFVFTALAGFLLLPRPGPLWLVLAVAAMLLERWLGDRGFGALAVMYVLLASFSSGLLADLGRSLLGKSVLPEWSTSLTGWVAVAFAALMLGLMSRTPVRWPQQVALWLVLVTLAAWVHHFAAGQLGLEDPGSLAALRTVILVVASYPLVGAVRQGYVLASRLVNPLLVVIGLKLLVQDLPWGRPLTLFVALFAYGTALLTVPRMLRTAQRGSRPGPSGPDSGADS